MLKCSFDQNLLRRKKKDSTIFINSNVCIRDQPAQRFIKLDNSRTVLRNFIRDILTEFYLKASIVVKRYVSRLFRIFIIFT